MNEPLISCRGLKLMFGSRVVMSELSFSVHAGDYLCIVGENGSGKSTLVKALLALKKASGGEIVFGQGLKANQIGYLPQASEFQSSFPASVLEVVLSGCLGSHGFRPFYSAEEKQRAKHNMEKLEIYSLRKRPLSCLSGGQRQRVLLARALCATKKLLLLDEPTQGLDPMITSDMYHLMQNINREGITVVMVSHDIDCAVKHSSHILHLQNKPLFFGKTEDYVKSETGKKYLCGCNATNS